MADPRCTTSRAYRGLGAAAMSAALTLVAACGAVNRTPEQRLAHEVQALRLAVPAQVKDPARAARVIDAVDGLGADLDRFQQLFAAARQQLHAAHRRPDITREELESLVTRFDGQRRALRAQVLQRHLAMVAATTADEWQALAPHERRALEAVAR